MNYAHYRATLAATTAVAMTTIVSAAVVFCVRTDKPVEKPAPPPRPTASASPKPHAQDARARTEVPSADDGIQERARRAPKPKPGVINGIAVVDTSYLSDPEYFGAYLPSDYDDAGLLQNDWTLDARSYCYNIAVAEEWMKEDPVTGPYIKDAPNRCMSWHYGAFPATSAYPVPCGLSK